MSRAKRKASEKFGEQSQNVQRQQYDLNQQMFQERQGYQNTAEGLLNKFPTYTIPSQIAEYQKLMGQSGTDLRNQLDLISKNLGNTDYLTQGKQDLLSAYDQAGSLLQSGGNQLISGLQGAQSQLGTGLQDMLSGLQGRYGEAQSIYDTGAKSLRDIMRKGVAESEAYAKTGMQTGLADTNSFLNFYRQQARQDLPGQRLLEDKLGRTYAEGYKALQQQAGSGGVGLGSMIDLYTQKANSVADLGIQAAQFQAQQQAQLGGALERATAIKQGIYDQMAQGSMSRAGALAGAEQNATALQGDVRQNAANAIASAQQYATGQLYNAGVNTAQGQFTVAQNQANLQQQRGASLADYAMNQQQMAQNQAGLQANIINQGITGQANLQGAGLMAGANAADAAYQYNQLLPWQTGMNYYTSLISSLNPYQAQSDYFNSQQNTINNMYQLFGKNARYGNPTYTGG